MAKNNKKSKNRSKSGSSNSFSFLRFILSLVVCFGLGIFLSTHTLSRVVVSGHSMDYTLSDGQSLFINRFPWVSYKVGDIVVLKEDSVLMVKRIVAKSGDRVQLLEDKLLVNGVVVDEPYVTDVGYPAGILENEVIVPEEEYLVLGDNRDVSNDSRYYGTVGKEQLVGLAITDISLVLRH